MRGFLSEDQPKCCGTCKWHHPGEFEGDLVCVNGESQYCSDYTDYNDSCALWEDRSSE